MQTTGEQEAGPERLSQDHQPEVPGNEGSRSLVTKPLLGRGEGMSPRAPGPQFHLWAGLGRPKLAPTQLCYTDFHVEAMSKRG